MPTQPMAPVRLLLGENTPALNRGEAAILHGLASSLARHLGATDLLLISSDPVSDATEYADVCRVIAGFGTRESRIARRLPHRAQVVFEAAGIVFAGCLARVLGDRLAGAVVPSPILRAYLGADVILLGHDNHVVGPGLSPQFLGKIAFSRLTGKVAVLCGGSFGPFGRGLPERMASWVLRGCTAVVLREPSSYEYSRALVGARPSITLGADPAFLMSPAPTVSANGPKDDDFEWARGAIGFTVSQGSLVDASAFAELDPGMRADERRAKHVSTMVDVVRSVAGKTGRRILLIAHSIAGQENDLQPTWEIFSQVKDEIDVRILDPSLPAPQVKTALSCLSLLVAERVHAAIAACSEGVPVVLISKPSDFRAYGIIGTMLGLEDCLYDVRSLEVSSLADHVVQCWLRRDSLRARLNTALPAVLEAADDVGRAVSACLRPR